MAYVTIPRNLPADYTTLPKSREEAKAAGERFFFNGKPCRWQRHTAPRYTSTNSCVMCQSSAAKRWASKDRESFNKKLRDKYANNKETILKQARERYWANADKSRKDCINKYYANHEHNKELARGRRARKPEQYREHSRLGRQRNKDKIAEYNRKYKEQNPHIYAAAAMARYTRLRSALPVWADLDEIREFYDEAKRRTAETGIKHQVDHMIPLQGEDVCGLHVPWNLRVITKSENVRKSNSILKEFL